MAWRWEQNTGRLFRPDGLMQAVGYSGHWDGSKTLVYDHRNRSEDQELHALGPIPVGTYTIGAAFTDEHKGPVVMHLTPLAGNEMFDRSGFLIHGDSLAHPGQASEGCIILSRPARQAIADSTDHLLIVERSA